MQQRQDGKQPASVVPLETAACDIYPDAARAEPKRAIEIARKAK